MDKWEKMHIPPIQTMLGLLIDTNRMIASIPGNYIKGVCLLIKSTWHTHHQQFTMKEAQELTGKLGHLAEGANWVFHLLTHLYASIACALLENNKFLADSSPEFQSLIKSLQSGYLFCNVKDQIYHISFAIKRSAKLVHQLRCQYNITKSMHQEIEFFQKLLPNFGICWESPIAHIIPRMPTFSQRINVIISNKAKTLHFVGQMYEIKYFMEEQMTKYNMRLDTDKTWDPTLDYFSKLFAQHKAYGNVHTTNSGFESTATMYDFPSNRTIATTKSSGDFTS
jgi:hypothetical protein